MDRTKRDVSLLKKIVKFCEEIEETHEKFGNTLNNFNGNKDYFKSVAMSLLQIGELVNHLSKEFRGKYNDVPYSLIVGLRNFGENLFDRLIVASMSCKNQFRYNYG